jgi:uncharacterized phage-associated protein
MARVFDVAKYILINAGNMSAMKLQKLVYYSQAWALAWLERPMFEERFEAWAGGPVSPDLYIRHRGQFIVDQSIVSDGSVDALENSDRQTIDQVIEFYGKHSAQWLSDLTHLENPWIAARLRAGALPGAFCTEEVTVADMAEYYIGLMANAAAETV